MKIPKDQILQMLRDHTQPGDAGKAEEAERQLPGQVDTEKPEHQSMLQEYGIDVRQLITKLGSSFGF